MVDSRNKISSIIDKDLKKSGKKEFAIRRNLLIGKKVESYGVRTSKIREIVRKYRKEFQELRTARDCFEVVNELISRKVLDDQMAGIFLLGLCPEISKASYLIRIEKLIVDYLDNWAVCDAMSGEVVARVLRCLPEKIEVLYSWAQSENEWLRRTTLVTTVKLKNRIDHWDKISSQILSLFSEEKEPIVKKAVSWLQKEVC